MIIDRCLHHSADSDLELFTDNFCFLYFGIYSINWVWFGSINKQGMTKYQMLQFWAHLVSFSGF